MSQGAEESAVVKGGLRARQREATRQRLFEAAIEIFRRDGVREAKIEEITSRAGTSRGSFYFHFPTKDDVLAELLARSVERVARRLGEVPADATIDAALEATARAIAKEWEDDARLFPDVGAVALRRTEVEPERRSHQAIRGPLGERFRAAQDRGEVIPVLDAETLADLFLVNQFAVAIAWTTHPIVPLEVALVGTAQLFLRGAGSRAG